MQIVAETAQKYSVQSAGQSRSPDSCAGYVSWTGGRHTPVDMVVLCIVVYLQSTCMYSTLYHQAQLKEQCQGKADSLIHSILFSALVLMYIFLVYSVHSLRPLSHTNFSASLSLLPPPKSKFFFSPLFRFSSSLFSLFLFSLWDFLSYYTLPHTFFFLLVRLQSLQVSLSFFVFFFFLSGILSLLDAALVCICSPKQRLFFFFLTSPPIILP